MEVRWRARGVSGAGGGGRARQAAKCAGGGGGRAAWRARRGAAQSACARARLPPIAPHRERRVNRVPHRKCRLKGCNPCCTWCTRSGRYSSCSRAGACSWAGGGVKGVQTGMRSGGRGEAVAGAEARVRLARPAARPALGREAPSERRGLGRSRRGAGASARLDGGAGGTPAMRSAAKAAHLLGLGRKQRAAVGLRRAAERQQRHGDDEGDGALAEGGHFGGCSGGGGGGGCGGCGGCRRARTLDACCAEAGHRLGGRFFPAPGVGRASQRARAATAWHLTQRRTAPHASQAPAAQQVPGASQGCRGHPLRCGPGQRSRAATVRWIMTRPRPISDMAGDFKALPLLT